MVNETLTFVQLSDMAKNTTATCPYNAPTQCALIFNTLRLRQHPTYPPNLKSVLILPTLSDQPHVDIEHITDQAP